MRPARRIDLKLGERDFVALDDGVVELVAVPEEYMCSGCYLHSKNTKYCGVSQTCSTHSVIYVTPLEAITRKLTK